MSNTLTDNHNQDPLAQCGARWKELRHACEEHMRSKSASEKEIGLLNQAESARHEFEIKKMQDERQQRLQKLVHATEHDSQALLKQTSGMLKQLNDVARARQEKIQKDLDDGMMTSKQHLEEAVWLAESVLETEHATARREFEETRGHILRLQAKLNESVVLATTQLKRYRQSTPNHDIHLPAMNPASCEAMLAMQAVIALDALERFRTLKIAGLFRGPILLVPSLLIIGTLVFVVAMMGGRGVPLWTAAAVGLVLSIVAIIFLWFQARQEVRKAWLPIATSQKLGAAFGGLALQHATQLHERMMVASTGMRDKEVKAAQEKWQPVLNDFQSKSQAILDGVRQELQQKTSAQQQQSAMLTQSAHASERQARDDIELTYQNALASETKQHNQITSKRDTKERANTAQRQAAWIVKRDDFSQWVESMSAKTSSLLTDWDVYKNKDTLPGAIAEGLAFGQLKLDLATVSNALPVEPDCGWSQFPNSIPQWTIPAIRPLPQSPSLLVEAPLQARAKALEMIQSAVLRLLTQTPPGKARFYFFDPVGLGQSFAGFMHLADEMETLVSERIWSEPRHIEQKLIDLTEYVETVIQKYLRNEFATIADYNKQAGELAEPLRFIVFADFPEGLTDAGSKRFASLLQSGARCGVHFILLRDPTKPFPALLQEEEILQRCVKVFWKIDRFVVDTAGLEDVPFVPASMPSSAVLQNILQTVGRAAKAGSRVEVPFQAIEPKMDQRWTSSSAKILRVPVGRSGANKLQVIEIGEGTRQHVLLAGKTGSGKSTLLHALITNVALWYSPDEVELWLIDFKKGVEFKAYATHALPHARAVAVESDREFGLSVLQGLDAELKRRGDLFRDAGVQDLAAWRSLGKQDPMPRTLLIVDEFQELFVEEDKVAQDSSLLLDRLVRQGRAFGMHVILGSQTLGGTYALPRTTMGQMGIRIALQCNEADSAMILSDDNTAARLLSRPGEAIYNDAGGLIEGNSPFQVVWLTDAQRDERVRELAATARAQGVSDRKMIVFDGTAAARIEQCQPLLDVLKQPASRGVPALNIFLGNPVAIRNASAITLRRQSGANIVVVGQREDVAAGLSVAALASFAAATRHSSGRVILLDGTTPDSPTAGALQSTLETLKFNAEIPNYRDCDGAILQLGQEVAQRIADGRQDQPPILLMIHGLQRYRTLRKDEDDFSMSSDGPPKPDKVLGAILRDGPGVGVHVFAWADTAPSVQRCIDRNALREFDFRVLMQMSANDSSYLMDTPTASRLGADRALIFSEEKGSTERFRPFELASEQVLTKLFTAHS